MNIFSEDVNTLENRPAINQERLKHSQEYRVLATLRYLFPEKYDCMVKDESPDLQDSKNSVGIEVTISDAELEMEVSRRFDHYCNPLTPEKKENDKRFFESHGYSVNTKSNRLMKAGGLTKAIEHSFKESIRKKYVKVPKYRTKCNKVGLALLMLEMPYYETETKVIDWTKQVITEDGNYFDFFYIISHRFCIYYEPANETISKHKITDDINKRLRAIGRMTAEGQINLGSAVWTD